MTIGGRKAQLLTPPRFPSAEILPALHHVRDNVIPSRERRTTPWRMHDANIESRPASRLMLLSKLSFQGSQTPEMQLQNTTTPSPARSKLSQPGLRNGASPLDIRTLRPSVIDSAGGEVPVPPRKTLAARDDPLFSYSKLPAVHAVETHSSTDSTLPKRLTDMLDASTREFMDGIVDSASRKAEVSFQTWAMGQKHAEKCKRFIQSATLRARVKQCVEEAVDECITQTLIPKVMSCVEEALSQQLPVYQEAMNSRMSALEARIGDITKYNALISRNNSLVVDALGLLENERERVEARVCSYKHLTDAICRAGTSVMTISELRKVLEIIEGYVDGFPLQPSSRSGAVAQ